MGNCSNCGVVLEPQWKFCVMCGTSTITAPAAVAAPTGVNYIPSVFRHDPALDDTVPSRRRVNVALLISIGVALIGIVLIVLVAVLVFTPRG